MTHIELALEIVDMMKEINSGIVLQDISAAHSGTGGSPELLALGRGKQQSLWEMALELVFFWEIEDRMLNGYYRE